MHISKSVKNTLAFGALSAFIAVALGAFGAHGLKALLAENGRIDTFDTAVKYQFYHALGLLWVAIANAFLPKIPIKWITSCFAAGTLFFSGSLYLLSITNVGLWGAVTPIGGTLFLAGWLLIFWAVIKTTASEPDRPV